MDCRIAGRIILSWFFAFSADPRVPNERGPLRGRRSRVEVLVENTCESSIFDGSFFFDLVEHLVHSGFAFAFGKARGEGIHHA